MYQNIGIIGVGKLGESMIKMLNYIGYKGGIIGSVRSLSRLEDLNKKYRNISIYTNNSEVVSNSHYLLLCVKPYQAKEVCNKLVNSLPSYVPVVSTMAGISLAKLEEWLPHNRVIRCMPNIPCIMGQGIVPYYTNQEASFSNYTMDTIFFPNKLIRLDSDNKINESTLVSGCGPALLSAYIDIILSDNTHLTTEEQAELMQKTLIGTGHLLSMYTTTEIIALVSSPGGATAIALDAIRNVEIDKSIRYAIEKARQKIRDMSIE